MLAYLKKILTSLEQENADTLVSDDELNLTAAILLVEVMMADHEVKQDEVEQLIQILQKEFCITPEQSAFLYEQAREKHEELVSLHSLTNTINLRKDQALKNRIIFTMWCIALVDGDKDKYEEHLIRKVADLLYVSHTDFIKARHEAEKRYTM